MLDVVVPLAAFSGDLFKQLLVDGVVLGSTYALLGVSFGIIYSTTGIFHFAHAVVYLATAYLAVAGAQVLGAPWLPAAVIGFAGAVILGVLIERYAYRPMRRIGASNLSVFLVALGLTIAGPNVVQIIFGPNNKKLGAISPHTYTFMGETTITSLGVITIVLAAVLVAALMLFLKRTKYGMATAAIRINPDMASAVGISTNRVYTLVFAIGSALVAVPALLFMANGTATPTMGLAPVLTGFIAVFLGGIGSMGGAAIGGLFLGLIASLSGLWVSADYQPAIVFGVLFLVLIVRPHGLFGRASA